jgi:hypothetical protein
MIVAILSEHIKDRSPIGAPHFGFVTRQATGARAEVFRMGQESEVTKNSGAVFQQKSQRV